MSTIENVSDTSLWVAYYRAKETERPDALFKDPLAKILIGERGQKIAEHMGGNIGKYTEHSVITRTLIIDAYIQAAIKEGVDTIINLGAGMDTRPYRMTLPKNLRWIEVDYSNIIQHKNLTLKAVVPNCKLERLEVDLADDKKRKEFLSKAGGEAKSALVLTEGVVPYLTEEQVTKLAKDLHAQPSIKYWVAEYFNPQVYRPLKSEVRTGKMKKAPFQFFPPDWFAFFEKSGWVQKEIKYAGEVGLQHGRPIPMPFIAKIFRVILAKQIDAKAGRMSGYVLFKKAGT